MQGRSGSYYARRLKIDLTYCDQNSLAKLYPDQTCKSRNEADSIAKDTYLLISYLEQYLDVAEFNENPIKYTINSF